MTFATAIFAPHHSPAFRFADLPTNQPHCLDGLFHQSASLPFCVTPIAHNGLRWYRNFNLLSFHYAFRPRVRSRLTLSGRTFLRKPWAFGGQDSHLSFRYSYRHSHLYTVHQSSRSDFNLYTTLPYPSALARVCHSFGGVFSPVTFSAQSHSTSELLRTL